MSTRTLLLLWMATMTAGAQSPSRSAITAEQVARALSEAGFVTVPQQVSLPAQVVADGPPALDILRIEPPSKAQTTEHTLTYTRVKLACHLPGQCVPFYALVNWPHPPAATTRSILSPLTANPTDIIMPAGTRATLVMDDQRSHIQVAVISLQNGMVGHRIRVASPDHKQFYYGEVVSANLLRGSF